MSQFLPSRYNFAVPAGDGDERIALFNAGSGALLVLDGEHSMELAASLLDRSSPLSCDTFHPNLLEQLRSGEYLIPENLDEVVGIRERYWKARGETPIVITLTTTMDCNLGCYYCYEERSGARLETGDIQQIVDLVAARVDASDRRAVHVDWYGGEPLLNLEFIEAASSALQAYCRAYGVSFVASIISNGSVWPDDVEAFVARHRIRQVQISFDGLKAHHDKRRRYRREYKPDSTASTFDRAVELVDRLVQCARVDLRFNADQGNSGDLIPFIEFARRRGWFAAPYPAVFQPARLASYSTASSFMRDHELSLAEFDALRMEARREVGDGALIEESEVPDGYPYPKTSVCAALANNSAVVGADGLIYRCGLQVGEQRRAVSTLSKAREVAAGSVPEGVGKDASWWKAFDPTTQPTCSICSFLPICWGGCPKKHLEGDRHALLEQGRYWRTNLPRLISQAAGFDLGAADAEVPDSLQFR
jgi:uncharacterized protein